jgi:gas vesicle protein
VDVFEEVENTQLSELLTLHANTLDEIAKNVKENVDKFVEEENEMMSIIEIQLKDLNEKTERLKHD